MNYKILLSEMGVKVILIILLIIPMFADPQDNYYTFIKWILCVASALLIILGIMKKNIAVVAGYSIAIYSFNPFSSLHNPSSSMKILCAFAAFAILISLAVNALSYQYEKL